jgi:hypothetical protein
MNDAAPTRNRSSGPNFAARVTPSGRAIGECPLHVVCSERPPFRNTIATPTTDAYGTLAP